jgi:hypothetical protein
MRSRPPSVARPPRERQGTRQSQSRQLVAAMKAWLEQQLRQIPPRGGLADAIRCSRLLDLRLVPQRVPRLFTDLALARGDGRHPRLLRALGRVDLLILDDWGLNRSTPRRVMTSWRSSRIATAAAPPPSPASFQSTNGTR